MYKVFKQGDGFMVYWCPSAPRHYDDKVPYNGKVYPHKQAAHRRCAQLNARLARPSMQAGWLATTTTPPPVASGPSKQAENS